MKQHSTRYPPYARQIHQEWTRQISESSESKVEVIYGRKAANAILLDPQVKSAPMPLWGEYSGIILFLLHEEIFQNAEQGHKFRRALIYARHPQNLFFEKAGSAYLF